MRDEGIQDGDCYTSNDCAIAGLHSADIYDIQPIFHEDKLIGWVGCVIMEAEIGALSPDVCPAELPTGLWMASNLLLKKVRSTIST